MAASEQDQKGQTSTESLDCTSRAENLPFRYQLKTSGFNHFLEFGYIHGRRMEKNGKRFWNACRLMNSVYIWNGDPVTAEVNSNDIVTMWTRI